MDHKYTLSQISLGCADGENEAKEERFLDMFYTKNNKYSKIMERGKYIISGRKGTGKTILAKYIEKTNNSLDNAMLVRYSKLANISLHKYIEMNEKEIDTDAYKIFQTFYIYKEIADIILKNKLSIFNFFRKNKKDKINPLRTMIRYIKYLGCYKKLKKFVKDRYPDGNYNVPEINDAQIATISSDMGVELRVQNVTLGKINSNGSLSEQHSESKKYKQYYHVYQEYQDKVLKCMKYVGVIFIIDDMDDISRYIPANFKIFLINLLKSVQDINTQIASVNDNSKCIVLIRDDILNSLNLHDGNISKKIVDANVNLNWMDSSGGKLLMDMLINKIKNSNPIFEDMHPDAIHKIFFPKQSRKQSRKQFIDELLKYSFGRPRDIVTYLNIMISDNPDESNFSFQMLKDSNCKYSRIFLNELENELSTQYESGYIHDIENLLKDYGRTTFNFEQLKSYFDQRKNKYPHIDSLENTVSMLYKVGALGNRKQVDVGKHFDFWGYRPDGHEVDDKESLYVVHSGLVKALNLSVSKIERPQ